MSEQKESSVLFSLQELMGLEEDRIRQEETQKASAVAAAEQARVEAERRAREEEQARIQAEEERRRIDEQRGREETAKLEAIRQAEVEKARVEAEQRARLEAMAAAQQHERSLAQINSDQSKKKLRNGLIGLGAAVVVFGGLGTFLAIKASDENKAAIAAKEAEARDLAEKAKKLEAERKEADAKVASLIDQLKNADDEATRIRLQRQLEEERLKQESLKSRGGGGPRPAGGAGDKPKAPCNCAPGDPLCSCL